MNECSTVTKNWIEFLNYRKEMLRFNQLWSQSNPDKNHFQKLEKGKGS